MKKIQYFVVMILLVSKSVLSEDECNYNAIYLLDKPISLLKTFSIEHKAHSLGKVYFHEGKVFQGEASLSVGKKYCEINETEYSKKDELDTKYIFEKGSAIQLKIPTGLEGSDFTIFSKNGRNQIQCYIIQKDHTAVPVFVEKWNISELQNIFGEFVHFPCPSRKNEIQDENNSKKNDDKIKPIQIIEDSRKRKIKLTVPIQ